jgi:signal transduction histidine kinase
MKRSGFDISNVIMGGVLLSIGVLVGGFQYQLTQTTAQFVDTFRAQNSSEMASGDVFRISSSLNAVTASLNWVCISAEQDGHVFFERQRGSCGTSFFQRGLTVVLPTNSSIIVHLTLRLPTALEISFGVSLCIQLLSLGLIFWGTKHAEALAHREDARLAELATQVAHDIRSPLAALDSVMRDLSQLPEEKRSIVRSAVSRIRDIANDLVERNRDLRIAGERSAAGILEAVSAPVEVHLVSSHLEPLISEKRLQFRSRMNVDIDGRLDASSYGLFARFQPVALKRVLSNLVNNAVEAIGDKGCVIVELTREAGSVVIKVSDNGKGIEPKVLPRLGAKGVTHDKAGGTGLGLYHARASVESWGGRLDIQSELGKGTAVTLRLPQAPAPAWFVSELQIEPGGAIVILDDDASIHQVWQDRFDSLRIKEGPVEMFHFSTPKEFGDWVRSGHSAAAKAIFLMDYELLGYSETGLNLIEEFGLGSRAVLVTSRFEERSILDECLRLGVRMIPKGMAGFVPIRTKGNPEAADACDAVLIDDDKLVRMVWTVSAKANGKALQVYESPSDFDKVSAGLNKRIPIYVDSQLADGCKGEEFARELSARGFKRIILCTGRSPAAFAGMPWINSVVGKEAPWS